MFRRNLKRILFFSIILTFIINLNTQPRKNYKLIVISPKVGEWIDLEERDKYDFFQTITNFQSAIFLQYEDSTYAVKINYFEDETLKSDLLYLTEEELDKHYRQQIEYFETQKISFYALKNPHVIIESQDNPVEGLLMGMEDDFVLVQNVQYPLSYRIDKTFIKDIQHIKVKKGTRFFKNLGYGILFGVIFGGLIGYASGDDPPGIISFSAEDKAAMGALGVGALGGIIGGISGLFQQKDQEYDFSKITYKKKVQIIKELSGL